MESCDEPEDGCVVVDIPIDTRSTAAGYFHFIADKDYRQQNFRAHVAYHYLRHNTCTPNCLLEGWKLGNGGEYRVLVRAGAEPIAVDVMLSADYGNADLPCQCDGCIVVNKKRRITTDDDDDDAAEVMKSPSKSPTKSPSKSPAKTFSRSPLRTPIKSPKKSPFRSPLRKNVQEGSVY